MKFYKWVVKYTKVFRTGLLTGMEVECEVTYACQSGAEGFCDYVTKSPHGMDCVTRRLFTVTRSSWERVMTYDTEC